MDPLLGRLLVVVAVVGLSAVVGLWWQHRDGRIQPADATNTIGPLSLNGNHNGPQAVLFTTPTCRSCRTVQQLLQQASTRRPDLGWHTIDVSQQLDLADQHDIRRAPTVLVTDADGHIVFRTSGVFDLPEFLAALPTRASDR